MFSHEQIASIEGELVALRAAGGGKITPRLIEYCVDELKKTQTRNELMTLLVAYNNNEPALYYQALHEYADGLPDSVSIKTQHVAVVPDASILVDEEDDPIENRAEIIDLGAE